MTYLPSAVIGGLISMSGIVVGNMAIGKTMDAYDDHVRETQEMFSMGEVVYPGAQRKRASAATWYRLTYPNGPLTKMLRIGQILTVAGFIVTVVLLAS